MREKYNDGPHLGNEWEYSRLLAWVQRPNAQLRYRIRKNLHLSLVNLRRGYQSDLSGTELEARAHAGHHLLRAEPCLGMHVRHGDAQNDERGRSKLDRSFEAHVSCAKTLAEPMGLTNIYIATDDNKVFTTAHTQFPEFSWFAQQRALKDFTGSSFEGYHSEKSAQAEVANIMVRLMCADFITVRTSLLCEFALFYLNSKYRILFSYLFRVILAFITLPFLTPNPVAFSS